MICEHKQTTVARHAFHKSSSSKVSNKEICLGQFKILSPFALAIKLSFGTILELFNQMSSVTPQMKTCNTCTATNRSSRRATNECKKKGKKTSELLATSIPSFPFYPHLDVMCCSPGGVAPLLGGVLAVTTLDVLLVSWSFPTEPPGLGGATGGTAPKALPFSGVCVAAAEAAATAATGSGATIG